MDKQTCAIKRAPLIAINGLKNESERNEQDGIRYMLMGFFQGPRNLYQDNHIGSGVSNTSPSRNHANLQAQCCKINIENCLPQPSMDVRFEDILEFKSKRKDELNAFRAKIRELEINIYLND